MTLKFFFGNARKDGSCALRIRFKANRLRDQKITIAGLSIHPKLWDKHLNRVLPSHPGYRDINEKIAKYESKMQDVAEKYRVGNINFETACRMLQSSSSMLSISDFIEQLNTIHDKSRKTIENYLNSVNAFAFHTGIQTPLFSDINFANIVRMRKSLAEANRSPATHNKYLRDLKAISRLAFKLKIIFELPEFDLTWRAKETSFKKVETAIPIDIIEAINKIKIDAKHTRSKNKTVKQFESVGLWLLMFSMRGMYPADINEISSKNLDYNFTARIMAELEQTEGNELSIRGNPYLYRHQRHKTEIPMKIMLNMPPISRIISVLRFLVSASHSKDAFQKQDESLMSSYEDRIRAKDPDKVDHYRIFSFTEKSDPKRFQHMWNNYYKQLREIGMPNFKIARKTFMTTATLLDIPQSIGRAMLGQVDPTISSHYNNFDDPKLFIKITQAHIKVLREFDIINIFNFWLKKIDLEFKTDWETAYGFKAPQDAIFKSYYLKIEEMVALTQTKIIK
ncbi:Arm DNA-binding domain-containing protein [Flavobacteriaceae bacterium]|jgi:hypothetical protein|nr:Arm DNA-binding domain-containing protein [Flavobacteriaceae bacterium]